ncbi:MAG TPA: GNAT family N-acetyltransferase [Tepidisphaeraceae bacterium]|nr:GNAT family N-acetyltransferase [Tepidisphaeraceae bacterium]
MLLRRPVEFAFIDPGSLVDGELQLVTPEPRWVDAMLAAMEHPLSRQEDPGLIVNRQQILHFLKIAPGGRQLRDAINDRLPTYHFWLHLSSEFNPPLAICGAIGLRIGENEDTVRHYGHIGYNVFPAARGHHYAERASRLLLPLAKRHGMTALWITCNPDNAASRRTCERLGAHYIDTVQIPLNHPLRSKGECEKCRYRIDL